MIPIDECVTRNFGNYVARGHGDRNFILRFCLVLWEIEIGKTVLGLVRRRAILKNIQYPRQCFMSFMLDYYVVGQCQIYIYTGLYSCNRCMCKFTIFSPKEKFWLRLSCHFHTRGNHQDGITRELVSCDTINLTSFIFF